MNDVFESFITETDAAEMLKKAVGTLRHWRYNTKTGPKYYKIGGSIYYKKEDIASFIAESEKSPGEN